MQCKLICIFFVISRFLFLLTSHSWNHICDRFEDAEVTNKSNMEVDAKELTTVDLCIEHSHSTLNSEDNTILKSVSATRALSSSSSSLHENNSFCSPNVHRKLQHTSNKWNTVSEAHAALKSFETSLGALTRTKKSIDRATRIAIDCAKYGMAVKVSYYFYIFVLICLEITANF